MNFPHRLAGTPITAALSDQSSPLLTGAAVTVPANEMSGLDFLDMVGLSSPERRAERKHRDQQACIRAIRRGDTYGFPPAMVAECKQIMADQPDFAEVGWGLAERCALGMPGVAK